MRVIKQLEEERKGIENLNEIELERRKQSHADLSSQKQDKLEGVNEQIKKSKELIQQKQLVIQETQSQQVREVSYLKSQIEMIHGSLQENRQKLLQNSQNSQIQMVANKIFKNLKQHLDGVKDLI
mmetsp:Transcript_1622/g.2871  ORF Transcript_1622/g.2871 Transcript_1622/m.2871 type:complete len:125 (+) Transcript_1622:1757-2131(+)